MIVTEMTYFEIVSACQYLQQSQTNALLGIILICGRLDVEFILKANKLGRKWLNCEHNQFKYQFFGF